MIPSFLDHLRDLLEKQKQIRQSREQEKETEDKDRFLSPCYNRKVRVKADNIDPHFVLSHYQGEFPK